MAEQRTTAIVNNAGGIMTDAVGVVPGQLTLRSELRADGTLLLRVRYKDADEWYTVTDGSCELGCDCAFEPVHRLVVGLLDRPEG